MIGFNETFETNFPHNLILAEFQVSARLENNSLVNAKLSKTQLTKTIQSGGFLGSILGPLTKVGLPLIKNTLWSLTKSFSITLGLTVAGSATDPGIHKKILG